MAVSKRTRFETFKRDRFTCQYCGRTPAAVILHCDHVIAASSGGGDSINNLTTSCQDCNLGKSNVPLSDVPTSVQIQMEIAAEKREQVKALNRFLKRERDEEDKQIVELGQQYFRRIDTKGSWIFTPGCDAERSLRVFIRKLAFQQIIEAMDIAIKKPATLKNHDIRFRYFCGICWRMIRRADGTYEGLFNASR